MKKLIMILILGLLLMSTHAWASNGNLTLGLEAGSFAPGNSIFKDVYGNSGFVYGANIAYKFTNNISVQGAFDMFGADGETTISGTAVSLNLNTARLGGYFSLPLGRFIPRAGAGLSMNWITEEGPFYTFEDSSTGWFAALGLDLDVTRRVLVGLEILYNDAEIEGDFGKESIGGLYLLFSVKLKL